MALFAVTEIQHGEEDGSVTVIGVGEKVPDDLGEDTIRSLIASGSVVETGKSRKYTPEPTPQSQADALTRKRDELLFKAATASDDDEPSPAVALARDQGALNEQAKDAEQANEMKAAGK